MSVIVTDAEAKPSANYVIKESDVVVFFVCWTSFAVILVVMSLLTVFGGS